MAAFRKSLVIVLVVCMVVMVGMPRSALARKATRGWRMRHMKLRGFFHDTLNKTDVLVARNYMQGGTVTPTSATFGSVFVFTDRVTAGQHPSSALLGSISGLATSVSFDGLTFFFTVTVAFDTAAASAPGTPAHLRGLNGTINIIGLFNAVAPTHPLSVVGGAGTFALAQGSATMLPIDIRTFVQVFSLDIDVYLPY